LPVISTQTTRRIVKRKKTVALKELKKTKDHQQKKSPRKRMKKVTSLERKTPTIKKVKPTTKMETNLAVTSHLETEKRPMETSHLETEKRPMETSQAVTNLLETEKKPKETSPAETSPAETNLKEISPAETNPETPRIDAYKMKMKRVQKDVAVRTRNVRESKTWTNLKKKKSKKKSMKVRNILNSTSRRWENALKA